MIKKRLDLGGTACYEDAENAIGITLDGSMSDDEVTPYVVGDYNNMWFFGNSIFDEALGSCYLEEKPNWRELNRVMRYGGIVKVKSCDKLYADRTVVLYDASHAGFRCIQVPDYIEGYGYDEPFIFVKTGQKRREWPYKKK